VLAVVALAVVSVVMATVTSELMTARRLLDHRQQQLQADWLARAGVELAAARLLSEPAGYEGETVELIPDAEVRVVIRAEAGEPGTFHVHSEARYPRRGPNGVTRSCTRVLRRTQQGNEVRIQVVPAREERS
jgi:hypothetical protein